MSVSKSTRAELEELEDEFANSGFELKKRDLEEEEKKKRNAS